MLHNQHITQKKVEKTIKIYSNILIKIATFAPFNSKTKLKFTFNEKKL